MTDAKNKQIDTLLQIRQDAMVNFAEATKKLLDLGVKIANPEGEISVPASFEAFLENYNNSNLEFEWEAEYIDGSKLKQFDGDNQHSFKDISLGLLKRVSLISNFSWPTDNAEKRIIISLDMKTGIFSFLNGFCPQETLSSLTLNPVEEDKKLILFARKRATSSMGEISDEIREFFPMIGETFYYNRFVLGFETPSGLVRAVMIEPNGNISLFEK